jgi:hypothetical protein
MTVYLRKVMHHAAQDVTTIYAVVKRSHHVYGQYFFPPDLSANLTEKKMYITELSCHRTEESKI